jgi:hypothetical protein
LNQFQHEVSLDQAWHAQSCAESLCMLALDFWYFPVSSFTLLSRSRERFLRQSARAYEQRYSQYYKSEAGRYIDSSHGSELQIVQPKSDSNASLCVSLARFEESVHSILRYAMCALDGKGCRTCWAACARFRNPKPRRIARRSS